MDRAVHRLFASLRALQQCKTEPAALAARKIGRGTNFVCGVADPVSTCVHPTEHPNLWGVERRRFKGCISRCSTPPGLRSGKFFTLLVAFFLFIPDLLMKVIHVVVVWACVVVFEKIF